MSSRLPILALLSVVGAGVLVTSVEGQRPTLVATPDADPAFAAPVGRTDAVTSTWYCAAGTAQDGGLADHTVVVANPTAGDVTGVLTVYAGRIAAPVSPPPTDVASTTTSTTAPAAPAKVAPVDPVEQRFTVPAHDRVSFRLATLQPGPLAAALVEADTGGVVVEHTVVGPHGQDTAPCASAASSTWHFAWGSTERNASDILVLFNPFPSDVTVDATFSTDAGVREPLRWHGLNVPGRSVVGVDVGEDVTRRAQVAASLRVRGGRLVVERLQSFDGSDAGTEGLSVALGQPEPTARRMFAHGRVDEQVSERIVLYNPGKDSAEVDVSVRGLGVDPRSPEPFGIVVRPGQFEIVDYGSEDRVARQVGHATVVESSNGVPVVSEQVLTFGAELSAGAGAMVAAPTWDFPVVDVDATRTMRLAVINPDAERSTHLSLRLEAQGTQVRLPTVDVPASGRIEVELPADRPAGRLGLVAEADAPVVVERIEAEQQRDVSVTPGIPLL